MLISDISRSSEHSASGLLVKLGEPETRIHSEGGKGRSGLFQEGDLLSGLLRPLRR